jgi:WD40 repeat protein
MKPQVLFAVKWIKDGKILLTGTANGLIIQWYTSTKFSYAGWSSVHHSNKAVKAIAVSQYEKYIISGDKDGEIVYSNIMVK